MNKKSMVIVAAIVSVLFIGGGAFAYSNDQNNKKEAETLAMEKEKTDRESLAKNATPEQDVTEKSEVATKSGSYVTLADYNSNLAKYADSKKVYFFHASWCPSCKALDKDISQNVSDIPAGVTIAQVDFDKETDLKEKYGVTMQHTLVQIDDDGNEIAQWSGGRDLASLLAKIK